MVYNYPVELTVTRCRYGHLLEWTKKQTPFMGRFMEGRTTSHNGCVLSAAEDRQGEKSDFLSSQRQLGNRKLD